MIWTACPQCGNQFKVDAAVVGKKGRCDKCSKVFVITEVEAPPSKPIAPILLAVAGLVIVGVGVSMSIGGGSTKTPDKDPKTIAKKDPKDLKDPKNTNGQTGDPKTTGDPDSGGTDSKNTGSQTGTQGGQGGAKGDAKNQAQATLWDTPDSPLRSWTDKPSPYRVDPKSVEMGRVLLVPGSSVRVNGSVLRLKVAGEDMVLYLPRGKHWVAQGSDNYEVTVDESYGDFLRFQRYRRRKARGFDMDRLLREKLTELDHPSEPSLFLWLGNAYYQQQSYHAAKRLYIRALRLLPSLAPAHFNLAWTCFQLNDKKAATRELRLAEDLDEVGTFGLEREFARLRDRLGLGAKMPKVELDPSLYAYERPRDDAVVNACFLLADLGKSPLDRVAAINNAGLRLLKKKRYQDAYEVFLMALAQLKTIKASAHGRLAAATIYRNIGRVTVDDNWPEKAEVAVASELYPKGS